MLNLNIEQFFNEFSSYLNVHKTTEKIQIFRYEENFLCFAILELNNIFPVELKVYNEEETVIFIVKTNNNLGRKFQARSIFSIDNIKTLNVPLKLIIKEELFKLGFNLKQLIEESFNI